MQIEQLYTGCLSQGAYYIESNGEAVVIDPLRETAPYLQRAKRDKATITYIFETHFHADFVSGHLTLSKQTGATIVFGPNASTSFDAHIAKDNEVFTVGDITITVCILQDIPWRALRIYCVMDLVKSMQFLLVTPSFWEM